MTEGFLRRGHLVGFDELPELVQMSGESAGLMRARVFVADLRDDVLCEMTGKGMDAGEGGERFSIDDSLPGTAFRENRALSEMGDDLDTDRWWVPVLDGTERLGVLRVDLPAGRDDSEPLDGSGPGATVSGGDRLRAARMLASLAGLHLVSKRPTSDAYSRLTRKGRMTVAAELEWNLMPPLSFANPDVVIAAAAEPAYDIGGDAFDYAVADRTAQVAVFDAMGHDSFAGLTASVAVAAFRNERRQGSNLVGIGEGIERALIDHFDGNRYATAVLADLDLASGEFSWVSRGHPPPIIIRGGRWVSGLECEPAHPLGMGLGLEVTVCREQLKAGDRIVLYTDGITEARDRTGDEFGVARFIEFLNRHHTEGLPVPETLRRLMRAILAHNRGRLADDATVLCLEWHGPSRNKALRPTQPEP
ncbi:serine/threonine-protein phosphatase [Streptomyces sp. PLK6-54]|uniref:Serine/threonine-protein phosphatase n=2 Tax=Actinacidiphila acidipaludis TaxID=2873382 RepID=A0ABS7QGY4_9ACTN|nr:serine/threonine-protein phosphatase [Streptomyces acidipaludis]